MALDHGCYNGTVLTLERIDAHGWAERLREEWRALMADSLAATPFQSWEWASSWWSRFGGRKRPCVLAVREGRDLVGLMPLYVTRGPWRALRTMGTGQSDYLQPLARTGYEQEVAAAVGPMLDSMRGVDLIDLQQLRETHPLAQRAGPSEVKEQARCCVLDLPSSFQEYLGTLGKSLRFDARKLDKEPFVGGKARLETVRGREQTLEALEVFLSLHSRRWRRRGLPGAFALPRIARFHREFVALAAESDLLRITLLKLEGQAVGAIYAMKAGNSYFFYQSGFDPSAKALCPGTLLVAHTIRMAIDEGMSHFDFLRGDEAYKLRWKPQHTVRNVRVLRRSSALAGAAGEAFNRAGRHVEIAVRRRLEGKGLLS